MTIEEVAVEDGSSVAAVQRSVSTYDRRRSVLTLRELEAVEIGLLQANADQEAKAIREALLATRTVQILDEMGRPVVTKEGVPVRKEVADQDIRLKAVAARRDKLAALQPKVGSTTNIAVGNQVQNSGGQYDGMESRLLNIREKRGLLAPAAVEAVEVEAETDDEDGEEED